MYKRKKLISDLDSVAREINEIHLRLGLPKPQLVDLTGTSTVTITLKPKEGTKNTSTEATSRDKEADKGDEGKEKGQPMASKAEN